MARIFLSHSSENNAEAIAVRNWLAEQGWDDVFLDLDRERGLKAGERWREALKRASASCELVLFIISPAWARSQWCLAEFLLAKQLNKRIFGVIIQPTSIASLPVEMSAEWQLVDLASGVLDYEATVAVPRRSEPEKVHFASDGLIRLRIGLREAGLDPKYFAWPPEHDSERPPYRGLKPLEAEDAGIFFGREGPIVEVLDRLRGLREAAPPRMLVLLGASGAGKSSFIRAGLLPRLARDSRHFLPLPVIRPDRAVLSGEHGLLASLEAALRGAGERPLRADVRAAVAAGGDAVRRLLRPLTQGFDETSARPTIILPIDQAEELFFADREAEAPIFLRCLKDLLLDDHPGVVALIAIRSDSYEPLQSEALFESIPQQTYSLPPMPRGAYSQLIEGPALRLQGTPRPLTIEEQLTAALLSDVETGGAKDALPLLAFTLERLYLDYGGDGHLRLADYEALGRIRGSIEVAAEQALRAADDNPAIPRDRAARLALLRRGMIPWLAGVDPESNAPRRRVARLAEIPEDARPLIALLVEQRLLTTDISAETGEITVEPAHETLLRQWGLLEAWLEEDFEDLLTAEGIKRAAREWQANARDPEWLAHTGGRLEQADRVAQRPDFVELLTADERAYLRAARRAEVARRTHAIEQDQREQQIELHAARERERASRRLARRTVMGLSTTVVLAVAAGVLGFLACDRWSGGDLAARLKDKVSMLDTQVKRESVLAQSVASSPHQAAEITTCLQRLLDAVGAPDGACIWGGQQ